MPTNNSINTPKPIDVSSGGTGLSTATTAFGVLYGGAPHLIWSSFYSATTNANAFKIFTPSLGTWTNGRACLYGIKK